MIGPLRNKRYFLRMKDVGFWTQLGLSMHLAPLHCAAGTLHFYMDQHTMIADPLSAFHLDLYFTNTHRFITFSAFFFHLFWIQSSVSTCPLLL